MSIVYGPEYTCTQMHGHHDNNMSDSTLITVNTLCWFLYTEPTLTLANVTSIMKHVQEWEAVANWIDIAYSKLVELGDQNPTTAQCKQACWDYLLIHHPAPSWRRLADGLYRMEEHEELEVLRINYPKGACIHVYCDMDIQAPYRPEHDMLD